MSDSYCVLLGSITLVFGMTETGDTVQVELCPQTLGGQICHIYKIHHRCCKICHLGHCLVLYVMITPGPSGR